MSEVRLNGRFLGEPGRRIFIQVFEPPARSGRCILLVPPFAEEMNKSRRMLSETASGLVALGYTVLLPDLFGTGDSEGEFSETSWGEWRADLEATQRWAREQGMTLAGLVAVRLGCALAVQAVETGQLPPVATSVLWQPVLDGNRHLTQFLRLRTAAALMESDRAETVAEMRRRLQEGQTIEVAGYPLGAELAAELDGVGVTELPAGLGAVHWMEVLRDPAAALPAPSSRLIERGVAAGLPPVVHRFVGEPFWTSTEIVRLRDMVESTVDAFEGSAAA